MLFIHLLLQLAGDIHPNPGPNDIDLNGLSIIHINARSLSKKIPLVHCEASCFDIITVSETWFSERTDANEIIIPGFLPPVRCDRSDGAFGGVAIYVKANLICKHRPDLCIPDLEAVWIETKLGQDSLLIGSFYRPPGANVAYWDLVDQSVQLAGRTPHRYVILGDFNADCSIRPPPHLQNLITINSLSLLVHQATRITEDSSTTLDLILTPCPDIRTVDVLPPICSDHSCPYVVLKQHRKVNTSYRRTLFNYSKLNVDKLNAEISNFNWQSVVSIESIDDAAAKFSEQLMSIAKHCMPVKEVTVNEQDAPWITFEIKKSIKKKNLIHKLAKRLNLEWTWALFRRTRNDLTDMIRTRKTEYFSELDKRISSPDSFGNKDWWKLVKSFISSKGMPQDEIPPIEENNTTYYALTEKATAFNMYFTAQCSVTDEGAALPRLNETRGSIHQLTLTTDMVKGVLKNLDCRKAVGPDLVHNKLLIAAADLISEPLTFLFNRSLTEGKFPSLWKLAHVTPIFKKGERQKCSNYRPISLLSCVGKVLEKCVQKHVFNYLIDNNLLTTAQSGFIPKDSTVFQLLSIYDDFCKFLDNKTTAQAIFFDISKAFDKVWHRALLHKLFAIGIRGRILDWFTDYLKNRSQAVVLKGNKSAYLPISAGVPQGSVLGPILFLVYINDITNDIESIIKLFADDTSMYLGLRNTEIRTQILNSDLEKIQNWAITWKVHFNESKTELMTISNQIMPDTQPLKFNDIVLQSTDCHKHLGVNLQSNGKWDIHINTLLSKCRILVACLRSYKYRLSRKSLFTMYKSFILPHFDFSDVVWDNCTKTQAEDLENLHLDAIRTIIGSVRGTSHEKLYAESGLTSLKERRRRHKIILYFKIVKGIVPLYLTERLPELVAVINPYHRRNPLERIVPRCRLELYKSSFFPATTVLWNNLPDNVKQSDSVSALKRSLSISDSIVPRYYYLVNRLSETIMCKMRLQMSDLQCDLYRRHLSNSTACACGFEIENAQHFLLHCPIFDQARNQTIALLPNEIKMDINILLFGSDIKTYLENSDIFTTVSNFIQKSERFASN